LSTEATLNSDQIQNCLEFAIDAAVESGRIARQYFRSPLLIGNKAAEGSFDPVTEADKAIEAYIRARISESFPEYGIVGEEQGEKIGKASRTWFIDPIDGTGGYMIGSPMWGTLLGLRDADNLVLGLMHQPLMQETYIGSENGAYIVDRNGKQEICTSDTQDIADAVLCCTHQSMFTNANDRQAFERVSDACKLVRLGTDCWGYTLLAQGFVDIVIENGLKPYDAVPLIPIVEAAGGLMTDWHGNKAVEGGRVVAAANAELHEKVLRFLVSKETAEC